MDGLIGALRVIAEKVMGGVELRSGCGALKEARCGGALLSGGGSVPEAAAALVHAHGDNTLLCDARVAAALEWLLTVDDPAPSAATLSALVRALIGVQCWGALGYLLRATRPAFPLTDADLATLRASPAAMRCPLLVVPLRSALHINMYNNPRGAPDDDPRAMTLFSCIDVPQVTESDAATWAAGGSPGGCA